MLSKSSRKTNRRGVLVMAVVRLYIVSANQSIIVHSFGCVGDQSAAVGGQGPNPASRQAGCGNDEAGLPGCVLLGQMIGDGAHSGCFSPVLKGDEEQGGCSCSKSTQPRCAGSTAVGTARPCPRISRRES